MSDWADLKFAKFVCGLNSEERELPLASRLYGMLLLEIRTYFVVTDEALAKGVFKYFDPQTMTLSEHELTSRLAAMDDKQVGQ